MAQILEPPEKFQFPFEPYPIQHDFMTALYRTLEEGKLGIFESPTGTGKSMSMICGALTWLENHERRVRSALSSSETPIIETEDCDGDWIKEQALKREVAERDAERLRRLRLLDAKEKEMLEIIQRVSARRKRNAEEKMRGVRKFNAVIAKNDEESETKLEDKLLLEDFGGNLDEEEADDEEKEEEEEEEEQHEVTKIFFCSRTHSQLSQLASELQRSVHANKRTVCLASRQSYCVNPSVRSLGNTTLINERCLELQKGSTKGSATKRDGDGCATKRAKHCSGCPFKAQERVKDLREEILAKISDVEELLSKGKEMKACPYYAARGAVKDAQMSTQILLSNLLHGGTEGLYVRFSRGTVNNALLLAA